MMSNKTTPSCRRKQSLEPKTSLQPLLRPAKLKELPPQVVVEDNDNDDEDSVVAWSKPNQDVAEASLPPVMMPPHPEPQQADAVENASSSTTTSTAPESLKPPPQTMELQAGRASTAMTARGFVGPPPDDSAIDSITVAWQKSVPLPSAQECGPYQVKPAPPVRQGQHHGVDYYHLTWKQQGDLPVAKPPPQSESSTNQCIDDDDGPRYSDVSYDPAVWDLDRRNNKLVRRSDESGRQEKQDQGTREYRSLPEDRSPSTRLTRSTQLRKEASQERYETDTTDGESEDGVKKKTKTQVGPDYQAVIPNRREVYRPPNQNYGEVLWDPELARQATERGENIEKFLNEDRRELRIKMLLLESLHKTGYNTDAAMSSFIQSYHNCPEPTVELSETQKEKFDELVGPQAREKKDFTAISKALGCSRDTVLVHYYRWKQTEEYAPIKRDRHRAPDECAICEDGGSLIICELCHKAYHLECLSPPLEKVPEGDWYCNHCMQFSPCRVRKLSLGSNRVRALDTSPPKSTESTLLLSPEQKKSLRSIHKELFPVKASEPSLRGLKRLANGSYARPPGRAPKNMEWDAARGVWVAILSSFRRPPPPRQSDLDRAVLERKNSEPRKKARLFDGEQFFYSPSATSSQEEQTSDSECTPGPGKRSHQAEPSDVSEQVSEWSYHESDADSETTESHGTDSVIYSVGMPITPEGLLLVVGPWQGRTCCFRGYTKLKNGGTGPAEKARLIRSVGDEIIRVDGVSVAGMTLKDIVPLLKEAPKDGSTLKCLQLRHIQGKADKMRSNSTAQYLQVTDQSEEGFTIPRKAKKRDKGKTNPSKEGFTIPRKAKKRDKGKTNPSEQGFAIPRKAKKRDEGKSANDKRAQAPIADARSHQHGRSSNDIVPVPAVNQAPPHNFINSGGIMADNVHVQAQEVTNSAMARTENDGNNAIIYTVDVPVTPEGLLIQVGPLQGRNCCFKGYRKLKNGGIGFAEQYQLFRTIGDDIVRVDGVSCAGMTYGEIVSLLKIPPKHGCTFKRIQLRHVQETVDKEVTSNSTSQSLQVANAANHQKPHSDVPVSGALDHVPHGSISRPEYVANAQAPTAGAGYHHRHSTAPATEAEAVYLRSSIRESLTDCPESFLNFLLTRRITTIQAFVTADSEILATDYAAHILLDRTIARDLVGASRMRVLTHLCYLSNNSESRK